MSGICNCAAVHARCDELWKMLLEERAAADRLAEALANLVDRFGIAQPHMGGEYRWGGFNPSTTCGRTMEDDDAKARAALAAHDARRQPATEQFVCPTCGDRTKVDEDGCCKFCGEDCTIEPLRQPATEGGENAKG